MLLLILLLAAVSSVALASPKGGQCYDCNYAPDGIVKNSNGTWAATKNDVFHHCALASSDNANYINKRNCISGRCFVRKDDNGMVFRGCADQWNLPWGIDTSKSCEQQSYQGSVWWFCDGDLCNNVDIEAECGSVPVRSGNEDPPVVTNIEIAGGFDPDHEVSMGDPEGGVVYAYPAEPPRPGYETVHGQQYAYWKDPPKRKRRPINRKSDGYQTRQTGPQDDDVYYSRISGQPVAAEPAPEVYLPVPQPENPPVLVEPVAIEEALVAAEPQPEQVVRPIYENSQNYWWNFFPFNYNYKQHSAVYPFHGHSNNNWQSSYAAEKPKQEEPKPVQSYQPNPKRTEVNLVPAQSSSGSWNQKDYPSNSWSQSTSYKAPETSYRAPEPSYRAPEPSYAAPETSYRAPETSYKAPETSYRAAETSYRAPKVTYAKPQAVYKVEYEAPAYVAPEPAPEKPVEYHSYQTNDDPARREYYADLRQTDTGYDRPYVYFAERNDPYEPADERGQTRLGKPAYSDGNPCDGHCLENPTGLFADPANPTGFIQCGSGFRNSGACDCCVPFHHQCPEGTVFDDVNKICGLGREVNGGQKRYSAVEY